jgi:DNA polymerase-3 subunit epsilon
MEVVSASALPTAAYAVRPDTPLVFLDLETTGANFVRDRILEIGIVEVDECGVREWATLIDPAVSITPFITGLTGIDDSMVVGAPNFSAVADELRERLRGKLFVAHSARFDYGFLKAEFARIGCDFKATVLCTVKLSRRLYPKAGRHNLDTLIERHGINIDQRHRALADAQVLWQLWQAWHAELGTDTVAAAITALVRPASLPDTLDPALADELPDTHGAFALRDETGSILQTGRATNLRSKVLACFADGRASRAPVSLVRRVDWTGAAGEFGARLAELAYQHLARPPVGDPYAWRLNELGPGDYRPELVAAGDADFGRDDNLYGLYATEKEARQALRKMAEAHFLCPRLLGLEPAQGGTSEKPCSALRTGQCRGVCIGKEAISRHSARLMTALARQKLRVWPYPGPVALVERDEFGMQEDFHLVDSWRYLGRANSEEEVLLLAEKKTTLVFNSDIYRCLLKYFQGDRLRVIVLPTPAKSPDR